MRRAAAALFACAGCALPVVSAGTFLPAGDLEKHDLHASVSMEAARVLAGPSDVDRARGPPEANHFEVSTWFASDVSLRWQALPLLTLEAQLKMTNPIAPFVPEIAGASVGGRVRLRNRPADGGFAVEAGARIVGLAVEEQIQRPPDNPVQTDRWDYRALGLELPLVATYRVNPLFAVTASPFARIYWIRAWHVTQRADVEASSSILQWSPVLSAGLGFSGALQLGLLEVAPGMAVELATRPGVDQRTRLLFQPGLSVGIKL